MEWNKAQVSRDAFLKLELTGSTHRLEKRRRDALHQLKMSV